MNRNANLNVEPKGLVKVGDRVTLRRPVGDEGLSAAPGWHPNLDRLTGETLTVRTVALGASATDNFGFVLVHETSLPIRTDWLDRN